MPKAERYLQGSFKVVKVLVVFDQFPYFEDANGINKVICNILPDSDNITYDILVADKEINIKSDQFSNTFALGISKSNLFTKLINWSLKALPLACADKTKWFSSASLWIKNRASDYDIIHIFGAHNLPILKKLQADTLNKVVFSSIDAMSLFFSKRAERSTGIYKMLLLRESRNWQKIEIECLKKARIGHLVSKTDEVALKALGLESLCVIENGVKPLEKKIPSEGEPSLCFWGDLAYGPNQEAVRFLINEIGKDGKHKIKLFGKNLTLDVSAKSFVEYRGFVQNISEEISQNDIFVCPLFYGTGIKNKLLEAFSYQVRVVASEVALDGLNEDLKKCCYHTNSQDPAVWRNIISKALSEDSLQKVEKASELTAKYYSWEAKRKKMYDAYYGT